MEIAGLTAEQAQVWLREIGLMFEFIKGDSEFCAFAKDENYTEDEKLTEYKKVQAKYRRSLKNRPDFAQVERFKQLIVENVEQLFAIFMADLRNVENGDSDFDYDTTNQTPPQGVFSMEALVEMVRRKIRPEYNEAALKEQMVVSYASHFNALSSYMPAFDDTVNCMFKVLNTPSLPGLDGMDSVVKESLNMVCMAEGLSLSDKRMHLDMLLLRYEVYLKKLYYLIHGEELPAREEGQGATLSNAIFAFTALRGLKNNPKPEYQEFSQRLSMLRQLRNHESHGSIEISEQEVDAAIRIVIDMYLFVTGMNVSELEKKTGNAENESHVIHMNPVHYDEHEPDILRAAEDVYVYGSVPVDLPKIIKKDLVDNKLDLVLMYVIGPAGRHRTEAAGKIALGIKEKNLNAVQMASYKSVKYLMFHYWSNPKAFKLTKAPILVDAEKVPSDFLVRQPNEAVKFMLLEYNPNEPADIGTLNILKTQRNGDIRYMPFVTTIESITEKNRIKRNTWKPQPKLIPCTCPSNRFSSTKSLPARRRKNIETSLQAHTRNTWIVMKVVILTVMMKCLQWKI